jgi:hypothetical protein
MKKQPASVIEYTPINRTSNTTPDPYISDLDLTKRPHNSPWLHRCPEYKKCEDKAHQFIKGTFDLRGNANSWDNPLRMISEKIKTIYLQDKQTRDTKATTDIVSRNKSSTSKAHEDYKKFVLENRSYLKDLLDKRRIERVTLEQESNQANTEAFTKPGSEILNRVALLTQDQKVSQTIKRSGIHNNTLKSLHLTHTINAWDQHSKLPLKAIKKVFFFNRNLGLH